MTDQFLCNTSPIQNSKLWLGLGLWTMAPRKTHKLFMAGVNWSKIKLSMVLWKVDLKINP